MKSPWVDETAPTLIPLKTVIGTITLRPLNGGDVLTWRAADTPDALYEALASVIMEWTFDRPPTAANLKVLLLEVFKEISNRISEKMLEQMEDEGNGLGSVSPSEAKELSPASTPT